MPKRLLTMLLLVLAAPFLGAQSAESLLIGPGDVLHVRVFDTPELEQHARVTDSGNLTLLLGGQVKVAGLPPAAAARAIESALVAGNVLLKPRVEVTVEEYATEKVSVVGEVKSPGAYALVTPRNVLDVLSLAGGLTELASRQVVISRYGTGDKVPYFVSNDPNVAMTNVVKINPGDTLMVPKAGIVYMLGDVKAPGGYTMTNNEGHLTALELLARAGGTPLASVPSHARLIRKTDSGFTEIHLPLSAMQKGKQADIELQPNDIVYVPYSYWLNVVVNASGIAASATTAAVYRF